MTRLREAFASVITCQSQDDNSEATDSINSVALSQGFQIQLEKTLPNAARPGLAAWSPKLDLLCFVTSNENVLLYRMNGQRVWGIAQRKGKSGMRERLNVCNGDQTVPEPIHILNIKQLLTKTPGKVIALGYSDGITRICDVNNGKVVLTVAPEAPGFRTWKSIKCCHD